MTDLKALVQNDLLTYLSDKHCFVKKSKIISELSMHPKPQIGAALRELRKHGKVKYGLRRWGINHEV